MARQCINIIQSWHQNLEITLLIYDKVCYKNGHKEGLSTESRISSDIELIFCLFTKRLYRSVIVVFSSIIYTKKERKKTTNAGVGFIAKVFECKLPRERPPKETTQCAVGFQHLQFA